MTERKVILVKDENGNVKEAKILEKFGDECWEWTLDLKNFEQVHGISRIAKLLPDKLATSIEINKERLPNPKDDGSFLIDLVLKLLKIYQDQLQKIQVSQILSMPITT